MKRVWQIGMIVRDLERTAGAFMELFHIKERPDINKVGRELTEEDCLTVYKGNSRSRASCMTCCFEFDNIEIEFIQPYGEADSEWKRFLDEQGEGIHHLGWKVEDMDKARELFRSKGYQEIQQGSWGEGEYHYFDTRQAMGFVIEALKFYDNKN